MRRTWSQRLVLGGAVLSVVALLATAGGIAYFFTKYSRLPRIEVSGALSQEEPDAGGVRNVLIVGVDSAAGLDPDDPVRSGREGIVGGVRSDTIMVLHVDPDAEQAALLSLPRDLWLPIAGERGNQRINTAIEGGPGRLIETIQQYLNIPINNYLQVDFAGFRDLVEAVDGIPVYFPTPARDRESGLDVPEAGCITLSPEQALAYARSRTFQTFENGRWQRPDPTGDLGRISRQQDFLRRALRRAVARGVRNPVTLDALIDAGLDSVVVDDTLTANDIVSLGNRFRGFNPDNLVMYSLPVQDDYVGGASIVRMLESEAQPILSVFRSGLRASADDEVQPSEVRVAVLNGSGRSGEARDALRQLAEAGFGGSVAGEAESFGQPRTIVRHTAGAEAAASLVASWLGVEPVFEQVDVLDGGDVVVVTGLDWAGVLGSPRAVTGTVPSTTASTSVPGDGGLATTTTSASTTSTTVIGQVPEQPAGVSC